LVGGATPARPGDDGVATPDFLRLGELEGQELALDCVPAGPDSQRAMMGRLAAKKQSGAKG
jgi:hypothetical protein